MKIAVWCLLPAALIGCGRAGPPPAVPVTTPPAAPAGAPAARPVAMIELPHPAQRLGTAVVVLVDTSPSMAEKVNDHAGRQRPKNEIAREALQRIVEVTDTWRRQHPDQTLELGLVSFARVPVATLPIVAFDAKVVRAAIDRIKPPGDGTAIGLALEEGFRELYSTGCTRKHLVCITDGQNTVGPAPEAIARQLHSQTQGEVELHFIAFNTSAGQFAFLKEVNGTVAEAADGAQLQSRLVELYEKKILAEAMPEPEE
ncbi:MAG: VWA domain-containing protein [Planctomycetaceae bacterium]|nr:VWA domain-containing protein [Planctomycetaceae bacterium]